MDLLLIASVCGAPQFLCRIKPNHNSAPAAWQAGLELRLTLAQVEVRRFTAEERRRAPTVTLYSCCHKSVSGCVEQNHVLQTEQPNIKLRH